MINVLLVDDNKFVVSSMQKILEDIDVRVVGKAYDGLQAIEQYPECQPDVVLLDITMPNMDGVECLVKIRELHNDARVVMISAIRDQATISKCLELGAVGFLQKPIRKGVEEDMEKLSQMLELATGKPV